MIFPEKMAESDTSLNRIYTYEVPDYIEKEELEFMIPLGVPETVGEITVRAYPCISLLTAVSFPTLSEAWAITVKEPQNSASSSASVKWMLPVPWSVNLRLLPLS